MGNLTERCTGGDSIDLRTGIQKLNISAKKIEKNSFQFKATPTSGLNPNTYTDLWSTKPMLASRHARERFASKVSEVPH